MSLLDTRVCYSETVSEFLWLIGNFQYRPICLETTSTFKVTTENKSRNSPVHE